MFSPSARGRDHGIETKRLVEKGLLPQALVTGKALVKSVDPAMSARSSAFALACAGSAATGLSSNNPATTIRIKKARPRIECHCLLGGLHPVLRCGMLLLYKI